MNPTDQIAAEAAGEHKHQDLILARNVPRSKAIIETAIEKATSGLRDANENLHKILGQKRTIIKEQKTEIKLLQQANRTAYHHGQLESRAAHVSEQEKWTVNEYECLLILGPDQEIHATFGFEGKDLQKLRAIRDAHNATLQSRDFGNDTKRLLYNGKTAKEWFIEYVKLQRMHTEAVANTKLGLHPLGVKPEPPVEVVPDSPQST